MSSLMRFEVLAPDKYVLKSDAISYVEAVTLWGGVGILPRHAPLIAALKEAPLKYRDAEGIAHFLCIQGGFMEVKDNKVVVMTEAAETADEIDVDRAEASRLPMKLTLTAPKLRLCVPASVWQTRMTRLIWTVSWAACAVRKRV